MLYLSERYDEPADMSFIHELQPTEILWATKEPSGRVLFLIQCREAHGAHVVDPEDPKVLWPQLVIRFYEKVWRNSKKNE
uniref:Chromo shadow domain-containing protein n=1 Tax=Glossina palpalis gambiensis TaxID=67801 RepID=A0A1B0ALM1_9MUSC